MRSCDTSYCPSVSISYSYTLYVIYYVIANLHRTITTFRGRRYINQVVQVHLHGRRGNTRTRLFTPPKLFPGLFYPGHNKQYMDSMPAQRLTTLRQHWVHVLQPSGITGSAWIKMSRIAVRFDGSRNRKDQDCYQMLKVHSRFVISLGGLI